MSIAGPGLHSTFFGHGSTRVGPEGLGNLKEPLKSREEHPRSMQTKAHESFANDASAMSCSAQDTACSTTERTTHAANCCSRTNPQACFVFHPHNKIRCRIAPTSSAISTSRALAALSLAPPVGLVALQTAVRMQVLPILIEARPSPRAKVHIAVRALGLLAAPGKGTLSLSHGLLPLENVGLPGSHRLLPLIELPLSLPPGIAESDIVLPDQRLDSLQHARHGFLDLIHVAGVHHGLQHGSP